MWIKALMIFTFVVVIFGLFFASSAGQATMSNLTGYITMINTEFFSVIPVELKFLFAFFIFLMIFALVVIFYN